MNTIENLSNDAKLAFEANGSAVYRGYRIELCNFNLFVRIYREVKQDGKRCLQACWEVNFGDDAFEECREWIDRQD